MTCTGCNDTGVIRKGYWCDKNHHDYAVFVREHYHTDILCSFCLRTAKPSADAVKLYEVWARRGNAGEVDTDEADTDEPF